MEVPLPSDRLDRPDNRVDAQRDDGGDVDAGGFHLEYGSGSMLGRIDVTSKKTGEDYYDLKAVLEEKGQK
jgi:hypothetical protein